MNPSRPVSPTSKTFQSNRHLPRHTVEHHKKQQTLTSHKNKMDIAPYILLASAHARLDKKEIPPVTLPAIAIFVALCLVLVEIARVRPRAAPRRRRLQMDQAELTAPVRLETLVRALERLHAEEVFERDLSAPVAQHGCF